MSSTWIDYCYELSPTWLKRKWGERFVGAHALLANVVSEGIALALRSGHVHDPEIATDSLALIASERGLPRYFNESFASAKTRAQSAWNIWRLAGTEPSIESQLTSLGFTGAKVYTPATWSRAPFGYWSEFWVFFPYGSHPMTAQTLCGGGGICGAGLFCGGDGTLLTQLSTARDIIARFKPVDWVCRELIFEITAATCGADGNAGGGAICGGSTAILGAT